MSDSAPQRVQIIDGAFNFRDLGGYRNLRGQQVCWGRVFRSGHLSGITPEGQLAINQLGLSHIHDFRIGHEQKAYPTLLENVVRYEHYQMDFANLEQVIDLARKEQLSAQGAYKLMQQGYIDAVQNLACTLGDFLKQLSRASKEAVIGFHCMAGKDRTGIAAASFLMALDIPEETIIEDYLLTQQHLDHDHILDFVYELVRSNVLETLGHVPLCVERSALRPYCVADEGYIESFFSTMKLEFGSREKYLSEGLGLRPDDLCQLRQNFLIA